MKHYRQIIVDVANIEESLKELKNTIEGGSVYAN